MNRRALVHRLAWGGACLVIVLLPPSVARTGDGDAHLLRLIDLLPLAQVTSPPLDAALAIDPAALPRRPLARLTATGGQPAAPAWTAGCRALGRGDHRGLTAAGLPCVLVTPVTPNRFLELGRRIFASESGDDLRVVELAGPLADGALAPPSARAAAALTAALAELPTAARFAPPALAEWRSDRVVFLPRPETRAVALVLAGESTAWVDRLEIVEVTATDDADLRLWASAQTDPRRAAPVESLVSDSTEFTLDDGRGVRQAAILTPAPTDLVFDLQLPDRARLSTTVGLWPCADGGDEAQFSVTVAAGASSAVVSEGRLVGDHATELAIDLGRWERQRVRLRLSARAPAGRRGWVAWGAPLVLGRGGPTPSLVLITVDRLPSERLSVLGYGRPTTPTIDRAASAGVLFTELAAASTSDGGALTALLGGRDTPLAARLGAHGYLTVAVASGDGPDAAALTDYDQVEQVHGAHRTAGDRVERALHVLAAHQDRALFLHLHLEDAAPPFAVPSGLAAGFLHASVVERFGLKGLVHLTSNGTPADCPRCARRDRSAAHAAVRDLHDAELSYLDAQLARLLAALPTTAGGAPLVAIAGSRGLTQPEAGARLAGLVTGLSELEVRVPLVIWDPRAPRAVRGKRVTDLASTADIAPTLLDLLGLPAHTIDGQSLRPHLVTRAALPGRRAAVVTRGHADHLIAVRTADAKYLLELRDGHEALFDRRADPTERLNLARRRPEETAALRLVALEALMRSRPGRYLAVFGDGAPRQVFVRLRSPSARLSTTPLAGLPRRSSSATGAAFSGRTASRLVLFTLLDLPGEADLELELHATGRDGIREQVHLPPERFLRAEGDALQQLRSPDRVGWQVFAGPAPTSAPALVSVQRGL